MGPDDPRYRQFVMLFNQEEFFEAHEVLEELWHETGGANREFLQGLIQVAVALEHRRRGNLKGANGVAKSARRHLMGYGPAHLGVDLESLLAATALCLVDPEAAPPRLA
jgi:uncharacterized protein